MTILYNNGYWLTNESYSYHRMSPSKIMGTVNWERLKSDGPEVFSPRHSHASCIFHCPHDSSKQCMWLTGGRTEPFKTFNLEMEDRTAVTSGGVKMGQSGIR